jgi:hypothetical protein
LLLLASLAARPAVSIVLVAVPVAQLAAAIAIECVTDGEISERWLVVRCIPWPRVEYLPPRATQG